MTDEKRGSDRLHGPTKKGQRQGGQGADHPPDDKKSDNELKREQPDLRQHSQGHGAKLRDAG